MAFCLIWQIDAAQPGAVQEPVLGDTWTLFVMVLKMCLTLGAVCLLAFVVLRYGLPRMTGLQVPQANLVKVVARLPLEQQKSLYVIEVTGKHLLLGVTQDRIEVLSELEGAAVQNALDAKLPESSSVATIGSAAVKEFSKYLRR